MHPDHRVWTDLRVWAPAAHRVEVESAEHRMPMSPEAGGWWSASLPTRAEGTPYAFVVDGHGPFPDPRSPWQPEGVHGPSRTLPPEPFPWSDQGFQAVPLGAAVIYELHIGTFTEGGTFGSAIPRLDHLVELGVTHVELMPVAHFAGDRGWGYDGVALYAPHAAYGGPEGMKRFVDACHRRGLAVLLDVVYNHLGPEGNYLAHFGPYFTEHYSTPWGAAVNLDGPGSHEVRRFFLDNARMWLRDYHVDGLRVDAIQAFHDRSALHFMEELAEEVHRLGQGLGRHLVIIAESDLNDPRTTLPPEAGGHGVDAQWSDDFHHALHALITGEEEGYYGDFGGMESLARALEEGFVQTGGLSRYRGRSHGRPLAEPRGERLVCFAQNHDQIGNRPGGDRLGHLISRRELKAVLAVTLLGPHIPLLFQGEEWAAGSPFQYFTDLREPGLGRAVAEGRRREFAAFGWDPEEVPDPQDPETHRRSVLDWNEREKEGHREILEWTRVLLRLRNSEPDFRDGEMARVRWSDTNQWLLMARGRFQVGVNLGPGECVVPVPDSAALTPLLVSSGGVRWENGGAFLPPGGVVVFRTG
ncbi:MAG: malto-oligosyltrehalose trehalohydrolase [Gemmatimonadales bacterium]|nr:MAG: malto-oligosyltrehalose trehalohydrolase [Gemmatimonadales bacterium]